MSNHNLLCKKIEEALTLASNLSTVETDKYARCVEELLSAKKIVGNKLDRSAECKCKCHTGGAMHFMECGCYTGDPVLE